MGIRYTRNAHKVMSTSQLRREYARKKLDFEQQEEAFFEHAAEFSDKVYAVMSETESMTLGQIKRALGPEEDDSYLLLAALESLRAARLIIIDEHAINLTKYLRQGCVDRQDPTFSFARGFYRHGKAKTYPTR